jgi:predicted nucleotidyltransferase component of viral defense system
MAKSTNNLAASVRQRLANVARSRGEDFQFLLNRFGLERLLYRLTQSAHAQVFVLKGATLFQLWTGHSHRPTRDLDLLGQGDPSITRFERIFREVCAAEVAADGLTFLERSVSAEQIKEGAEYQGIRLRINARLGNARIPLQIDVGFGDAVTPGPVDATYPTLLDFPAPLLLAYPRESVVAEKFQAMVVLGIANSRMKDFYDIWILASEFDFSGLPLSDAIRATFERRQTPLPTQIPMALTAEFADDRAKATQWTAFLRKSKLTNAPASLSEVTALLNPFLMPPTATIATGKQFDQTWLKGGPWR